MTRVLIIEDQQIVRDAFARALRDEGFDVDGAATIREAIGFASAHVPDVALVSLEFADGGGIEAVKRVRQCFGCSGMKVIILASSQERGDVIKAARARVNGYLIRHAVSLDETIGRIESLAEPGQVEEAGGVEQAGDEASGAAEPITGIGDDTGVPARADAYEKLATVKPMCTRMQLRERLEEYGELQAMPPVVARVMKLTRNQSASLDDVVHAVRSDQAISVKLLRLANSSAYERGGPVDSIERAVGRIGMSGIKDVVIGMGIMERYGADDAGPIDHGLFWEHSIACALIASKLAEEVGEVDPGHAFTMGLLHDLGRLVFADVLGEDYGDVIDLARRLSLPLEQVEARRLILTHADGIAPLLRSWSLPPELTEPLINHHVSVGNARKISPKRLNDVAVLGLANRLCHAALLGSSGNEVLYSMSEHIKMLRLHPMRLQEIVEEATVEAGDLRLSMLGPKSGGGSLAGSMRVRLGDGVRPIFAGPTDSLDAARMFFVSMGPAEGTPTLSVVRVEHPRCADERASSIEEAEKAAGTGPLPTLVVADNENCIEAFARSRPDAEAMILPATTERIIASARALVEAAGEERAAA